MENNKNYYVQFKRDHHASYESAWDSFRFGTKEDAILFLKECQLDGITAENRILSFHTENVSKVCKELINTYEREQATYDNEDDFDDFGVFISYIYSDFCATISLEEICNIVLFLDLELDAHITESKDNLYEEEDLGSVMLNKNIINRLKEYTE